MYKHSDINLIDAVIKDDVNLVHQLLDQGISPDYSEDEDNVTALQFAVVYDSRDTFFALLAAGADAHKKNSSGQSAIDLAKLYNRTDFMLALMAF